MNLRASFAGLGLGLSLAFAHAASGAEIADDTKVQQLGQPFALRKVANQGPAAARQYLNAVASRYQAAGYPGLANKLRQANATLGLFAARPGPATSRTIQTARAELRALKASLAGVPKIAEPSGSATRVPHYWNLALTFSDLGSQIVASASRRGTAPLAAFIVPNRAKWVEITSGGSYITSGGSSNYGGSYGSVDTMVVLREATRNLVASIDERWVAFPPGSVVPEELVSTLAFFEYSALFDPATGETLPPRIPYRRVLASDPIPVGAHAFPPGNVKLHEIWKEPADGSLQSLGFFYFGLYAITSGNWYVFPPGVSRTETMTSFLEVFNEGTIGEETVVPGSQLVKTDEVVPAGAIKLPVPFLVGRGPFEPRLIWEVSTVVVPEGATLLTAPITITAASTWTPSPSPTPAE